MKVTPSIEYKDSPIHTGADRPAIIKLPNYLNAYGNLAKAMTYGLPNDSIEG